MTDPIRLTFDDDFDDTAADAAADRFCDGFLARGRGKPRPADPDEAEGWDEAKRGERVVTVMPERPEGYYHMPIGTFD